ncbi:hypothetical protein M2138_001317 [Dysgonomonadaceae bacterium PH5-43]|nr:hypothetical protein [Dysgonomonadaceae bacterium PH5-43]
MMNNICKVNAWGMLFCVLIILFSSGCSNEESEMESRAIAFDCSTVALRAASSSVEEMQYFRVSAFWNKGADGCETFMNDQLVEKRNGSWVYSPMKYMPGYGSVSFFAYAPASSAGFDEPVEITPASNRFSIKYTVSNDYQQQEDLMVATKLNKTTSPISLSFKHALSFVNFQIRSESTNIDYRISKVELVNLYSQGELIGKENDEKTSDWYWEEDVLSATTYTVYQKYPIDTHGTTFQDIGDVMVLPQKPIDFKIVVTYSEIGSGSELMKDLFLDPDFVFEMGKRYTFFLRL